MGHELFIDDYPVTDNIDEIVMDCREAQEEATCDCGYYDDCIVIDRENVFASRKRAHRYLEKVAWDNIVAVRYNRCDGKQFWAVGWGYKD